MAVVTHQVGGAVDRVENPGRLGKAGLVDIRFLGHDRKIRRPLLELGQNVALYCQVDRRHIIGGTFFLYGVVFFLQIKNQPAGFPHDLAD